MSLEKITQALREKTKSAAEFGKSVKFDFGGDGVIHVDGNKANEITNDDKEADCTVSISMADFVELAEGRLNPMNAFMGGKLKIAGDMSVAMKLQTLLG